MNPSQITVKKTAVKTGVHQAVQSGKRVERVVEEETDEVEEDGELTNSQALEDLDVSEVIQNMVKNVSLGFFVCHRSFQDLLSFPIGGVWSPYHCRCSISFTSILSLSIGICQSQLY
jgi:hypothetical protein